MRYLILSADYLHPSIFDESTQYQIPQSELSGTPDLLAKVEDWNHRYQPIMAASLVERRALADAISSLDAEGISLARQIEEVFGGNCKVKYYSEGLWRVLLH